MRKLTPNEHKFLELIAKVGGSYCPGDDLHPEAARALHELVKAKRLTTEHTDAGPRYHLTAQGAVDASA